VSTRCDWIESRLESLLSNDPEVRHAVDAHTRSCAACQEQIEGYDAVDRLLGSYFARRMDQARTPAIRQTRRLVAAAAALAALALIVWVAVARYSTVDSIPGSAALDPDKAVEHTDSLAKPSEEAAPARAGADVAPSPASDAAFYVMDASGYNHTLNDFQGSVIVLGVFDETQAGARTFGQIYDAIPSRSDLQFLAVGLSQRPPETVRGARVMVNRGSSLLGVAPGEFAVLTPAGEIYRRGTLSDTDVEARIRSSLEELGVAME